MLHQARPWEKEEAGISRRGDVRETNPSGLRCAVAIRYKDSGQNKPKPVIFFAIYRLQRKLARFSANLNTDSHQGFQLSSLQSTGYSGNRPNFRKL